MTNYSPKIYFYIPQQCLEKRSFPEKADIFWLDFGGDLTPGVYVWTIQTYLRLKEDSFNCELVSKMPESGIVLAHWDCLPPNFQPHSELLVVCLQADRNRHLYAQIHIVQNPNGMNKQLMDLGDRYLLPGEIYYMPHWPQTGLIPRDESRGDRFENIAFLGDANNLEPQLKEDSWQQQLQKMGLQWHIVGRERAKSWPDFSYVDAMIAVRSFGSQGGYGWKPAQKLYNAWHAGIPAILGSESAYQQERKSELDYIEVNSLEDTLAALKRLRDDRELRQKIVANGRIRAQETNPVILTQRWKHLILEELIPAYDRWCNSPLYRHNFLQRRRLARNTKQLRKNLQKIRKTLGIRTRLRSTFSSLFRLGDKKF